MPENTPIWGDPDVQRIYDLRDGEPFPRFFEFNNDPDQLDLVASFVQLDMENGQGTPSRAFVDACLAGVRVVEELDGKVDAGWIKFFVCQVDRNNSLLWDQHRGPANVVAAIGEWIVMTIHRHGWGPDGNSTPLGQCHSNAMAVAAEAGGGMRLNPTTGRFEYGDGSDARQLAGVGQQPLARTSTTAGESTTDQHGQESWDALQRAVESAEDGDEASQLLLAGAAADAAGEQQRALELYERAARLGEVQAMYEAGLLLQARGEARSATFWFEAAADGGNPNGYSRLAQLSETAGDSEAEREWSRKGAEAGDGWCMGNFAYFLLVEAQQAAQRGAPESEVHRALRECRDYAARAARLGHVNAMYSAGLASAFLGRRAEARDWLVDAEEHGHSNARGMIERFGL